MESYTDKVALDNERDKHVFLLDLENDEEEQFWASQAAKNKEVDEDCETLSEYCAVLNL